MIPSLDSFGLPPDGSLWTALAGFKLGLGIFGRSAQPVESDAACNETASKRCLTRAIITMWHDYDDAVASCEAWRPREDRPQESRPSHDRYSRLQVCFWAGLLSSTGTFPTMLAQIGYDVQFWPRGSGSRLVTARLSHKCLGPRCL